MTQARTRANGLVIPSPSQLWLTAMLRAFVELVLHAASTLRMILNRKPRDWHTQPAHDVLPGETNGNQQQETELAAPQSSPTAFILRSASQMRVSKDEGVLTSASNTLAPHRDRPFLVPLIRAKAGTQSRNGTRAIIPHSHTPPWIPAFARMSGVCAPNSAPA